MLYKNNWHETKDIFKAWWNRSLERPLIQVFSPRNNFREASIDSWAFLRYYPDANKALNKLFRQFSHLFFGKEAYPNLWINLGPGILSACLGAELKFIEHSNTAWFEGNMSLDGLSARDLELNTENKWWKYLVECTEMATRRCRGKAIVGFTDLLDVLTVTGELRGRYPTNLLRDMHLNGNKLKKVLDKIHDIWLQCYEELCKIMNVSENGYSTWAGLWSKRKHFVPQCDTIVYLSPKLFERFAYPYVVEECRYFDRTVWHLDGLLELQYLDKLIDIPELDGIQWIPGAGNPDAGDDAWLSLYRKIQANGKLLQLYVQPEKVMHTLSRISPEGVAIQTTCKSYEEAKKLINEFELKYG